MDSNTVNRWLTLGANVGVMVGLILLIVEIDQNSQLVRIQIEQSRSETYVAWMRQIVEGEHAAPLYAKMDTLDGSFIEKIQQLDRVEAIRYATMIAARYYDYENLFSQYQQGFVSQSYWEQRIVPAVKEWGPRWIAVYPPDGPGGRQAFIEEVRRILNES